jgi:Domain of unknown function (DUF5916)/Carbohydrate family 9 binding domain-like
MWSQAAGVTTRDVVSVLSLLCVALVTGATAQTPSSRPELRASRTETAPVIDGNLDDDAWQHAPLETTDWLSYNPLYGEALQQRTTVWVAYDADNLYFAFKCDDPEAAAIKTSVTRRDNAWQDDWVGLSLDALGSGQLAYHMMANPSGVQMDMLNSVAGGEDSSPDWIWDSAARLTDEGYTVEIRLPLQSIRFEGGADPRMGILFWRRVSRLGVSVSWPPLSPGVWVFERHASIRFAALEPRRVRELLPSATYSNTSLRETPDRWGASDNRGDVGFGAKIGLTPTITLDATINPDFSQVESDAFQVEVNQRFPIFFSEKRPFFMEGAGVFSLAGAGGDNSLRTAVHTRRIIDPIFGAKLTGSIGRVTFATLTAVDEASGPAVPPESADYGKNRVVNVARVQYGLGPGNYVGALATDTEFAGGYNRVIGTDLSWRVSPTQRISGFALASGSRAPHALDSNTGAGAQVAYDYSTDAWEVSGAVEHYDPNFAMETAFINRVALTGGWSFQQRNFYPDKTRYPWIRRVSVLNFMQGGHDRVAGGNELLVTPGMRFNFTRQGFLRVDRSFGFEHWQRQRFDRGRWRGFGEVQLFRWLYLNGELSSGLAIFYDSIEPYQGRSLEASGGVTLQPNGQLSQRVTFNRVEFERDSDGSRVYTLDIVNAKTTYQFTRALAARALVQYDSSRRRVLTDFLGSYEPRPGTVVFVGYGSLLEKRDYVNGEWIDGGRIYRGTQRGVFVKASYLYRF